MTHEDSKLFVGGLPETTTHADLVRLFATSGPVFGVKLVMDRKTNRSKGFAFVEMATPADAQAALKKLDGHKLVDRRIFVTPARAQEKRPVELPVKPAAKPAAFVERRSGKDRRAQPPAEAARRKPDAAAGPKKTPANPGGFGPGFTSKTWKRPNRARR